MSRPTPFRTIFLTLTLAAGPAACGSVEDDDTGGTRPESSSSAFPVSVKHKFGTTEIKAEPQRIVALGNGGTDDIDALYALGVTPVAIAKDSFSSDGVYP